MDELLPLLRQIATAITAHETGQERTAWLCTLTALLLVRNKPSWGLFCRLVGPQDTTALTAQVGFLCRGPSDCNPPVHSSRKLVPAPPGCSLSAGRDTYRDEGPLGVGSWWSSVIGRV